MSTVIKPQDRLRRMFGVRPLNLEDLEATARRILDKSNEKAREILCRAQEEGEELRQKAREDGRRDGYKEGHEQGTQSGREEALRQAAEEFARDQKQLCGALRNALSEFEEHRAKLLAGARTEVIRLAMEIARRVTKRYAAGDTQVAVENVRESLERIGRRQVLWIEVHPADGEALRRFASELSGEAEHWKHVAIVHKPDIEPGGCRVGLPDGQIDGLLDTQLDRIAAALLPGEDEG